MGKESHLHLDGFLGDNVFEMGNNVFLTMDQIMGQSQTSAVAHSEMWV